MTLENHTYKVVECADDLLFYITQPLVLLPVPSQELLDFHNLPNYKVNV